MENRINEDDEKDEGGQKMDGCVFCWCCGLSGLLVILCQE